MNEVKEYLTKEDVIKLDKELKLIPITFDYMFKGLFKENLDLLKKFLVTQLELDIKPEECNIRLLDNELVKENKNEYQKVLDLYVLINECFFVDIEVNSEYFENIKLRNSMYESKLYSMVLEKGDDIKELGNKYFIQLNLNTRERKIEYGEDKIVLYGLKTEQIYTQNRYTLIKYLEYYRKLFYNQNRNLKKGEIWLVSFTCRSFTELYDILGYILTEEERERYLRKAISMSKDNFILHEWEKEKLDELVNYEREKNALKRGREETTINHVKNMLNKNYDLKEISEITGLTEEEIMKIKESN